jgi:hypothetical protein
MPQAIYKNKKYNIQLQHDHITLSRANLKWVLAELAPDVYSVISCPAPKFNPQRNLAIDTLVILAKDTTNPNIYRLLPLVPV